MTARELRSDASGTGWGWLKALITRRKRDPLAPLRPPPTVEERERLVLEQFEEEMELALAHGVHQVSAWFNAASLRGRALDQLVHDGYMTCTQHDAMVQGRREPYFVYAPTKKARQPN